MASNSEKNVSRSFQVGYLSSEYIEVTHTPNGELSLCTYCGGKLSLFTIPEKDVLVFRQELNRLLQK